MKLRHIVLCEAREGIAKGELRLVGCRLQDPDEIRIQKPEIRINSEIRMTKRASVIRASSFVIDSGFWFRHSDFANRYQL